VAEEIRSRYNRLSILINNAGTYEKKRKISSDNIEMTFADITFTHTPAENLGASRVTANCLHPGVTATKLLRAGFPEIRGKPPAEGALLHLFLALSPEVESVSGKYCEENTHSAPSSALTYDKAVQERLWKTAEGHTGTGKDI
jgi:NAD(P)-dependent dehydrogenase (short-subunit alcohol dehydrogenase family)